MTKTVFFEDVGAVTLRKLRTAKRIALKVKPTGEVWVTLPYTASYQEAARFAEAQKEWILQVHKKVSARKQQSLITSTQHCHFPFFRIEFCRWETARVKVQYRPPVLEIFHPENLEESDARIQEILKEAVQNILRIEARKRLPAMLDRLAKKHGFTYQKLSIRKAATRWGSCSSQKNINLSVYLMLLPDELIEYVILHELCHTLEMNHGPKFYAHMDRVTGGKTQELKRRIKTEGARWNFLKY